MLGWLGDCLGDQLYGGQNDLVVNCASMAGGATRSTPVRQLLLHGPQTHHLNYFERAASGLAAVQALAGIEHGALGRGGEVPKRRAHAPIVLLLPDIMGSHLQVGSNRIWFDPVNLVEGRIERLALGQPHIVSAGWIESCYEPFARFLAQSQEVRPFTYDWRLSLQHSGKAFLPVLDEAMHDAEQRGQPLRIVAHGMGGLVARLALKDRWQRFGALPGSRLLQVGTANRGTQAMVQVLLGRDPLVRMLACWIGWKHTRRQFLGFVRAFPGVLEMLPRPQPQVAGSIDYFDAGAWAQLAAGGARHRGPAGGRPARCPPLQLPGRLRRHAGGAAPARRGHRDGLVAGRRWPHGLARRGAGRRGSVLPAAGAWRPAAAKRNLPGHRATARQRPGRGPAPAPAARAWRRPAALPCVRSRCAAAVPAAAGTARRRPRRRRPRQRCREPRAARRS